MTMDERDIPGLTDYLALPGVIDSTVNRTAYRLAWFMMQFYNEKSKSSDYGIVFLYSEKLGRWMGAAARLFGDDGFVPLYLICQEDIGPVLDLRCSPDCTGDDGDGCRVSVPHIGGSKTNDSQPALPAAPPHSAQADAAFEHIVRSWDGELPDAERLAQFYLPPMEGEGGGAEA